MTNIFTTIFKIKNFYILTILFINISSPFSQLDMYNLRVYFNKQFAGLYKFKQDQMDEVLKRNNRLRKIQSELNILAELKGSNEYFDDVIIDPEYQLDEEPEKIIKVNFLGEYVL